MYGYQIISELGRNREGGRITWLASDLSKGQQVVLKQFCFAMAGSSWSAYNAHKREIEVLQGLDHPGIPHYLGAFETLDGFCLIQEYKNAPTLAAQRSFEPDKIKQIAVKILSILVYLQNRIPPVIHRDIKPENILVDHQLNVYLIDFGMSRLGTEEVSGSSVLKGTCGFIPPEQMRKPTEASDLYGLGATLICLLTGTKSTAIQNLTDNNDPYKINFRHLLPQLSLRFLNWLELMVQPELNKRFNNAQKALEALLPVDVVRVPGVELNQSALSFQATRLNERLKHTVTVENPIPDTVLEGRWEVAPHPQDPPHTPDSHSWISVEPSKFSRNHTVCQINVDTSRLMANQLYKRQLLLHTNGYPEIYPMQVRVQTAPLPIEKREVPLAQLAGVLLSCVIASATMTWFISVVGLWAVIKSVIAAVIGAVVGVGIGSFGAIMIWSMTGSLVLMAFDHYEEIGLKLAGKIGAVIGTIGGVMIGSVMTVESFMGIKVGIWIIAMAVLGWRAIKIIPSSVYEWTEQEMEWRKVWKVSTYVLLALTAGLGISFGIGCMVGLLKPSILFALFLTGLPLFTMLCHSPLKRHRLIAKHRHSEERLIKP